MVEPDFFNETPFVAELLPILDLRGREARVAIIKASYAIAAGGALQLAETARPLRHGDEPWGKPEIPDIKLPGDLCEAKPATDVVIVGRAVPSRGRRVQAVDVEITLADRKKRLRAFGERRWTSGLMGLKASDPATLEPTPLSWCCAFGGADDSDPARPIEESRNPIGRGFKRNPAELVGQLLPSIEDPDNLITSPASRPAPAGCSAVGRSFMPRRSWAGTYDDEWLQEIYPARPADYDPRFENCAPPDQVFAKAWTGGESIQVSGMTPDPLPRLEVPRLRVIISGRTNGKEEEARPFMDTVVLDVDEGVLELVWRKTFPVGSPKSGRLESVRVVSKEFK